MPETKTSFLAPDFTRKLRLLPVSQFFWREPRRAPQSPNLYFCQLFFLAAKSSTYAPSRARSRSVFGFRLYTFAFSGAALFSLHSSNKKSYPDQALSLKAFCSLAVAKPFHGRADNFSIKKIFHQKFYVAVNILQSSVFLSPA